MIYKLKDLVEFKPGFAFKTNQMTNIGIDLIKIGNLKNNKVVIPSDVKIENSDKFQDYLIKKNDILMALTGDPMFKGNINTWVGRTCMYRHDIPAYLNQRVCKLIPKNKDIDNAYLFYWLSTYCKTYEIASLFHGSANQANISHRDVGEIEIDLPEISIQRKISTILSDIDLKIELNSKINNNLHELISNMYTQYLNKNTNSDNYYKAKDLLSFDSGVEPGSKNYISSYQEGTIKFYRVGDMLTECSTYVDRNLIGDNLIIENDVVVSFDATIGRVSFGLNGGYSTGMRRIRTNNSIVEIPSSFIYAYFTNKKTLDVLNKNARGTTILHAGTAINFLEIKVNDEINNLFKNIDPLFNKMLSLKKENETLSKLRDTLLQKLMNGEIDLNNIEI